MLGKFLVVSGDLCFGLCRYMPDYYAVEKKIKVPFYSHFGSKNFSILWIVSRSVILNTMPTGLIVAVRGERLIRGPSCS